uniref:Uncharacterized protein n=1 Tax=Setaria viridis TaxID=4556 RepID=A0A4U6TEW5_SETVI|nr:hypothetical protein SEVIR_8G132600v2 [Setaria viridis]
MTLDSSVGRVVPVAADAAVRRRGAVCAERRAGDARCYVEPTARADLLLRQTRRVGIEGSYSIHFTQFRRRLFLNPTD